MVLLKKKQDKKTGQKWRKPAKIEEIYNLEKFMTQISLSNARYIRFSNFVLFSYFLLVVTTSGCLVYNRSFTDILSHVLVL